MLFHEQETLSEIFHSIRHELHRGALDHKHPFRYISLATQTGIELDLRYVVLREVDSDMNLYIFSDARTKKVLQARANPKVAFLFYHPKKRVQIRIKGEATVHQQDDVSLAMWSKVQGESKRAYNPVIAPGNRIAHPKEAHQWPGVMDDENFSVIKISPKYIDALQLNAQEHLRVEFCKANDDWEMNWIAP
jgi:pyridoxine/pyridoxamine 5'-phosphate oxidase